MSMMYAQRSNPYSKLYAYALSFLRLAGSVAVAGLLFSVLPFTHRIFPDKNVSLEQRAQSAPVVMQRKVEKEKTRQRPQRQVRQLQSNTVHRSMDFSMRFTPDLGVGGGSGVAVAGEKIGTMVFDESDVDVPPRPISRIGVDYPRRAREAGIEGTVSLVLVISRTGKVTDVSIEHSPSQLFNNPVIQTVRQWKFEPAQKGGVAVQVRMRQNISFKLDR